MRERGTEEGGSEGERKDRKHPPENEFKGSIEQKRENEAGDGISALQCSFLAASAPSRARHDNGLYEAISCKSSRTVTAHLNPPAPSPTHTPPPPHLANTYTHTGSA